MSRRSCRTPYLLRNTADLDYKVDSKTAERVDRDLESTEDIETLTKSFKTFGIMSEADQKRKGTKIM